MNKEGLKVAFQKIQRLTKIILFLKDNKINLKNLKN